jgi:hypothetical protein
VAGSDRSEIVPPVAVVEGIDSINAMYFFRSVAALDRFLEPWFPEEEAYRAYDSEGRKLVLTLKEQSERAAGAAIRRTPCERSSRRARTPPPRGTGRAPATTASRGRPTAAIGTFSIGHLLVATMVHAKVIG